MGIIHKPKKHRYRGKYKNVTIYDDLKSSSNPFLTDKNSLSFKERELSKNKKHKVVKHKKKEGSKTIPVRKHKVKSSSLGEVRIQKYLFSRGITFEREIEMLGMTNIGSTANLRFDFYLPHNRTAIEYDGIQHFYKSDKYDTKNNTLENRQLNDSCKDRYCKSKKIKLIRIPYMDFRNIELILSNELL